MLAAQLVAKLLQFFILEFEQPIALGAMKMIVLRISIIMLIHRPAIKHELAQ